MMYDVLRRQTGIPGIVRFLLLKLHLLNEEEFWGEYVFPMISRSDPSFEEQEYWRGRIWAPTNFLVTEGLRRAGLTKIASEAVRKGLNLFIRCWKSRGVVGENYNAITGEAAEPSKASDRFYHWGALLVYMAVQEIVDFQVWDDRVKRASVPDWLVEIKNIPVPTAKE